jgi:hypothetical protein
MNLELIPGLVGVLVGSGTLIFAFLAWSSSRKSARMAQRALEISEEQLRLTREQAEMRPYLEVTEVRLLEPEDAEGVSELLREVEEQRARERAWEEKSKQIERMPITRRLFEEDEMSREYTDLSVENGYEGPLPDKVVRVNVINRGKSVAFAVTGLVYFESSHLEPLGYFSGGKVFKNEGSTYRAEVGHEKDILLTPDGDHSFDIAVAVRSPGTTWIVYDLSSPTGSFTHGMKALEIPDL